MYICITVGDHRDRGRQLARVRHRELDPPGSEPLGDARRPPRQPHARLRTAHDLDLAPGEVDADAERLPDRLLAGETGCVVLRRVGSGVAVGALGLREAAVAEAGMAVERAPDPLDLDQVDAEPHRFTGSARSTPAAARPS